MLLFWRTEGYYAEVAHRAPARPQPAVPAPARRASSIVPTTTVNLLTERALSAALSLGDTVVAVAVAGDEEESRQIKHDWETWRCAVPLEVLVDPPPLARPHRAALRRVASRTTTRRSRC